MNAKGLAGKRIVITRARREAGLLGDLLARGGATTIAIPGIEIREPRTWEALDSAIRRLADFDYLLFTSANGVRSFVKRFQAAGRTAGDLGRILVGAIGPATARELTQAGLPVNFTPREYRAEGLMEALEQSNLRGKSFLIPRANIARDLIPRALTELGAYVDAVEAYQTVIPRYRPGELEGLLDPRPDMITFTSSSSATNFVKLLEEHGLRQALSGAAVASIGPVTSETVRELELEVSAEAEEATIPALVRAIERFFDENPPPTQDKPT